MTSANTLAHASSLYKFACYLQESLPYFWQLQRRDDPPAPKFYGFEQNLGWNWANLLGMFRHSLDMHEGSEGQARDGAIAARSKFADFASQINLTDEFRHALNDVMPDIVFASLATAGTEATDISYGFDYMNDVEVVMDTSDATGFSPAAIPPQDPTAPHPNLTASSSVPMQPSIPPQLETQSRSPPQPTAAPGDDTRPDGGHSQNSPSQTRVPAVLGLRAIWERKKAEAAATKSIVEKQTAATRVASFELRKSLPAVPDEDEKDAESDKDNEDPSVEYIDCKGNQMRTPESLRSLKQLTKEFSRKDFQERLTYEFTDENLDFEINELYDTGEKVSKSFVSCIVLACQYIICSRRREIARARQILQEQVFRDAQVNLRRLQKRLEKKEKTPEFCSDETLVNLLADLRKVESILDEDGQVSWKI